LCGLIGAAGNLVAVHEKAIRTLLILDSLRGEDSTGIACVGKWRDAEVKVAKQVGDPFQLFEHKSFDAAMRSSSRAIIGHNRYATVGGINRQTAHPFENPSIVGVHNGTLRNKHVLADSTHYKVDSENLYHHIHKHGLDDFLRIVDGAYSLVWWDKDEEALNFLRNKERPMWCTHTINQKGDSDNVALFWASEPWMLDVALGKHGISHNEPFPLAEDTLYTLPIGEQGVIGKPVLRKAPGLYVPPVYNRSDIVYGHGRPLPQQNKQVSNVVVMKKEEPATSEVKKSETFPGESYDRNYLAMRQIKLELLQDAVDVDGADYISCFDAAAPYKEVRLYPRKDDTEVWEHIGGEIYGDISGWTAGKVPGKGVYKVGVDSFKIIPRAVVVAVTVKGPTGADLTEEAFYKRYPTCSWCTSPLVFGDANRFSTACEAFCPGCATNKDVLEAVNF
jgi:predicted glutamine amidotransferase